MTRPRLNENIVYQAVIDGELEIEPDGTIWRVAARRWNRWTQTTVLIPCSRRRAEHDAGEYLQVRVMWDKVRTYALAHRLVYLHFKGPIPPDLTVNHEDGLKKCNRPTNLELATYQQQTMHARQVLKVGRLNQRGEANPMVKLTDDEVKEIRRRRAAGEQLNPLALEFDVAPQTISRIARLERR